jgi:hypothetical protein
VAQARQTLGVNVREGDHGAASRDPVLENGERHRRGPVTMVVRLLGRAAEGSRGKSAGR